MDDDKAVEENTLPAGIAEVKTFIDLEGRQVKQFLPIDGSGAINKGLATIKTPEGPQPFEFNCQDGYSLEDCFANFDEDAKIQLEEYKTQLVASQNEIIVPK